MAADENKARIVGPLHYEEGYGVLSKIGEFGSILGKKALLVGSPKSLPIVKETITKSLEAAGISHETYLFRGYPTRNHAGNIAGAAKRVGADFIIAAGGGRVVDTGKYAGELGGLRVITVPTISATNASCRVNSIIYNEENRYVYSTKSHYAPAFVLADLDILAHQPARYLKSGIIDTLVRWIEMRPYLAVYGDDLNTKVSSAIIHEAYDFLIDHAEEYLDSLEKGKPDKRLAEAIHSVIGVCSLSANYTSGRPFGGLAHAFYYAATETREASSLLHGEVVGFGILLQLLLEGYSEEAVLAEYKKLRLFSFDYSLEDIGLRTEAEVDDAVDYIVRERLPKIAFLAGKLTAKDIQAGIYKINDLVLRERKNHEQSA